MLATSLPVVVKEVMEAMKTSSLVATKSIQEQAATNDQDNYQEEEERNTAETIRQQSEVDSAVQQQTVNIAIPATGPQFISWFEGKNHWQ